MYTSCLNLGGMHWVLLSVMIIYNKCQNYSSVSEYAILHFQYISVGADVKLKWSEFPHPLYVHFSLWAGICLLKSNKLSTIIHIYLSYRKINYWSGVTLQTMHVEFFLKIRVLLKRACFFWKIVWYEISDAFYLSIEFSREIDILSCL